MFKILMEASKRESEERYVKLANEAFNKGLLRMGHLEVFRKRLPQDEIAREAYTYMRSAIASGKLESVRFLLELRPDVEMVDAIYSVLYGNTSLDMSRFLLDRGLRFARPFQVMDGLAKARRFPLILPHLSDTRP